MILDEFPALLTYEEARTARGVRPDDWGENDRFEIAVNALGWAGLIRREGDLLVPVRAARQMYEIGFEAG